MVCQTCLDKRTIVIADRIGVMFIEPCPLCNKKPIKGLTPTMLRTMKRLKDFDSKYEEGVKCLN